MPGGARSGCLCRCNCKGHDGAGQERRSPGNGFLLCGGADGYAGFGISAGDGCGGAAGAPGRGSACRKHSFPAGRKDALDGMFEEEVAVFPARNAFYFRLLGARRPLRRSMQWRWESAFVRRIPHFGRPQELSAWLPGCSAFLDTVLAEIFLTEDWEDTRRDLGERC